MGSVTGWDLDRPRPVATVSEPTEWLAYVPAALTALLCILLALLA